MTHAKRLIYQTNRITDLLSLLLALLLIGWYESQWNTTFSLVHFMSMRMSLINFFSIAALGAMYILVLDRMGLYKPQLLPSHFSRDTVNTLKAVGLNTLLLITAGATFEISIFDPIIMLTVFLPLCSVISLLMRALSWQLLKNLNLGDKGSRNVLVIGSNRHAADYGELVKAMSDLGYTLLGYIDDEAMDPRTTDKRRGGFDGFAQVLDGHVVDEVVVCMPAHQRLQQIQYIITRAHTQGILVRFPLMQLFKELLGEADFLRIECGEGMISSSGTMAPELTINSGFQLGWRFLFKRLFDLTAAPLILLAVSPVLLVSAILIARTPGPVFFRQERYGYNGRIFKIYKFRTMVNDADRQQAALRESHNELDGAAFKMQNDPRVTRVGKFLRKTSIDELPQLFNVLLGDMSLVGPRPLPLADYEQFKELAHLRRLSVLPGITCHWQASGRNNIQFDEWMELDMEYVDNWSLRSDIKILLKTIPAVLRGSGAS